MKIVIDIPESIYQTIEEDQFITRYQLAVLQSHIRKGVPLPKGHGRLIDADAFIARMEDASKRQEYKKLLIDDCLTVDDVFNAIIESLQNKGLANGDAPTIIEADKAESEDKHTEERTKSHACDCKTHGRTHACDCISRQAVIDTIETDCSWDIFNEWGSRTPTGECIINAIKSVPSVEPERKTGKWIKVVNPDTNEWVGGFKCSECDRCCAQMSMNYCANCGAPMEVSNDT